MSRKTLFTASTLLLVSSSLYACLWDYDTLQQERAKSPATLELITGKFLRHSPAFYEWRIKDRSARLEKTPNDLSLRDDLAVAYDKLGKHSKAIELMQSSLELEADRYETLANLGTFYIHSGKLKKGAEFIEKAIEINPDAHFGREKYQLSLVKYVLSLQNEEGGTTLPLDAKAHSTAPDEDPGFVGFHLGEIGTNRWDGKDELPKMRQGLEGMMRFGNHDSPILLETLGDVLLANEDLQLAARAYLKASDGANDEMAREAYRKKAEAALTMQRARKPTGEKSVVLKDVEKELRKELDEASVWYQELEALEARWTVQGSGVNPDEEFSKLYHAEPVLKVNGSGEKASSPAGRSTTKRRLNFLMAAIVVALGLVGVVYRKSLNIKI